MSVLLISLLLALALAASAAYCSTCFLSASYLLLICSLPARFKQPCLTAAALN
jgi:hypothetical protein